MHFPDFASTQAGAWWQQQLAALHGSLPYDGLWLDMNEVSSFCTGDVCSGAAGALPFRMLDTKGLSAVHQGWKQKWPCTVMNL